MSANATCDVQRCPAWRQSSGVKRTSAGDCRPMAIYKLQHCYSLLSSPAEKLVCARLMRGDIEPKGDRRGKGCHGCHMNHSALTARLKRFLVVPVSPERTTTSRNHSAQCRFGGATGFNCHNFQRPTQAFGDFGNFVMQAKTPDLPK